jgi:hypothetical protein
MLLAAEWFVDLLVTYAVCGAVFALAFVILGVQRIDSSAHGSGWGFRVLIFPGVAALWPLLLHRWYRGLPEPELERNPHRQSAFRRVSR